MRGAFTSHKAHPFADLCGQDSGNYVLVRNRGQVSACIGDRVTERMQNMPRRGASRLGWTCKFRRSHVVLREELSQVPLESRGRISVEVSRCAVSPP